MVNLQKSTNNQRSPAYASTVNGQKSTVKKYSKMATVIIPTPLRKFTNNTAKLEVASGTIAEAIQDISTNFPDLKKHLLDDDGKLRTFLNIFVGDDDIRDLQNEHTSLSLETVVSIIPAIAGGRK
jgi:molybdopterin converting factor small subunit